MSAFVTSLGNLGFNVVSGAAKNAVSWGVGKGQGILSGILGDKSRKTGQPRFYYDKDGGGGLVNVVAKGVVGNVVGFAKQQGVDQLKSLFFKKRLPGVSSQPRMTMMADLDNKSEISMRRYGVMPVNEGSDSVIAVDFAGHWCVDAVMLGVPVPQKVSINQIGIETTDGRVGDNSVLSDTLVWWDVTGLITVQNERKVITTHISGRDYSRKELLSNGDVTFSITGRMNSNLPDVYPSQEVRKFIQIMQYKGPVKIVSQFLDQYNITKMVVTGYSLPQKEGYRNIQEYTVNCVGIQPDKDVSVTSDTVMSLDIAIQEAVADKPKDKFAALLDDVATGLKSAAVDASASALSSGGAMLEKMVDKGIKF